MTEIQRVDDESLKKIRTIRGHVQGSFYGSFVKPGTQLVIVKPEKGNLKPGDIATVQLVLGDHMVRVEEDDQWSYMSHEVGLLPDR